MNTRGKFPFRNLWTGEIVDPDEPGALDHPLEKTWRSFGPHVDWANFWGPGVPYENGPPTP